MVRLFTDEQETKQGQVRESRVMLWPLDSEIATKHPYGGVK